MNRRAGDARKIRAIVCFVVSRRDTRFRSSLLLPTPSSSFFFLLISREEEREEEKN